eukprot:CAMPEP_0113494112 /NCGR_PEP_ID=MMETSP0014_2-20120614/28940_1 /TAXON_ID=2857 /ORGANISM="Nitzschia sp." /LENGTH=639 /DNA_ID=CAMNT_0000387997 /DNA_START=15 /DNA_END=1934 /DNA_ORIENTATION=- /assembly_acc=CAM_ASM_000159
MSSSDSSTSTTAAPSSSFRDAVFDGLNSGDNFKMGENGCLEYTDRGVGSDILAISQVVRGGDTTNLVKEILDRRDPSEIVQLFTLIFVVRNTRGGKGEKDLSHDMFLNMWTTYPETCSKLLPCFVQYGYWKDLLLMMEKVVDMPIYDPFVDASLTLMKHQWDKDVASLSQYESQLDAATSSGDETEISRLKTTGPKISLLSKWLPREGKSFDKSTGFVGKFTSVTYPTASSSSSSSSSSWQSDRRKKYRCHLTKLTEYLSLPEVLLAANRADEIEIGRVASKATKLLSRAFLNETKSGEMRSEDAKRMRLRELFLDSIVERGLKGTQVMPHEIVSAILKNHRISTGMKMSLDAQWKSIWKDVVDQVKAKAEAEGLELDPTRMVSICDVSGSMSGVPMEVSIALGIGISEITHPDFRHMVMTFSESPEWFRLDPHDTIVEKVRKLAGAPWGGNTNFETAYDLVLQVCVDNKLPREDMPCLIVFSDMQFDQARGGYWRRNDSIRLMFDHIRSRVKATASKLGWTDREPTPIVFWNLRNTGGHPVNKNTEGTVLLSGFSPSLLKLVMNGEALKEEEVEVVQKDGTVVKEKVRVTPEEILKKMLDDPIYNPVRKVLATSTEGVLKSYTPIIEPGDGEDDFEII